MHLRGLGLGDLLTGILERPRLTGRSLTKAMQEEWERRKADLNGHETRPGTAAPNDQSQSFIFSRSWSIVMRRSAPSETLRKMAWYQPFIPMGR